MWSGVRYVWRDPVLRPAVIAATGIELAAQALFLALPVLAYVEYDRRPAVAGLLVAHALPLWVPALDVPPAVAAAALLASGLADPLVTAPFTPWPPSGCRRRCGPA